MRQAIPWFTLFFTFGLCAAEGVATKPATGKPAANSGTWDFGRFWAFKLKREESAETHLGGREIWYKDRGPARHRMHVFVETSKENGKTVLFKVPAYEREMESRGAKRTLRFDPTLYDQRENGRRVFLMTAAGSKKDLEALRTLVRHPWFEMVWADGAWVDLKTTAKGYAFPIADGLALNRELALLLPSLPEGKLRKGLRHQQTVVLPYPAPLSPAPTATVTYQVKSVGREEGKRVATVELTSTVIQRHTTGIEWGGIQVPDVRSEAILTGQLKLVKNPRRLFEARLKLQIRLKRVAPGESFKSDWKLSSDWKSTP